MLSLFLRSHATRFNLYFSPGAPRGAMVSTTDCERSELSESGPRIIFGRAAEQAMSEWQRSTVRTQCPYIRPVPGCRAPLHRSAIGLKKIKQAQNIQKNAYLCHAYYRYAYILLKRFMLYPLQEIANFKTRGTKQSKDAHACRISTPRQGGYRYPVRRGSGLFISCKAFGDASCKINKNIIPRFFV